MRSGYTIVIKKRLIRLNLVLVAVLLISSFIRFSGFFQDKISQIKVESDFDISGFDIYQLTGFDSRNILSKSPDISEVKSKLENIPEVRKAYVEKQFPETLRLVMYQREAVGMCIYEQGGESCISLFDKTGFIYKDAGSSDNWDLPVLSGFTKEAVAPGNILAQEWLLLAGDLAELKENSPSLFSLISEIHISEDEGSLIKSEVSFVPYRIKVILGNRLKEGKIKHILIVLDEMKKNGMDLKLDEIDFRSGEAVFTRPEEQL